MHIYFCVKIIITPIKTSEQDGIRLPKAAFVVKIKLKIDF